MIFSFKKLKSENFHFPVPRFLKTNVSAISFRNLATMQCQQSPISLHYTCHALAFSLQLGAIVLNKHCT